MKVRMVLVMALLLGLAMILTGCLDLLLPRYTVEREMQGVMEPHEDGSMEVKILGRNGRIEVETVPDTEYSLEIEMRVRAESDEEAEELVDDVLVFRESMGTMELNIDDSRISARIIARVPEEYLYNLDLSSSNGSIAIQDLAGETLTLNTSNGGFTLNQVQAETIRGNTSNGPVNLEDVIGDTIRFTSSNGSIEASVEARDLHLETSNGTITLHPDFAGSAQVYARTSNGHIYAFLPFDNRVGYEVRGEISNGTFDVDFTNMQRTDQEMVYRSRGYEVRSWKVDLRLRTSNGDIEIRER